jgi:hypothetical protein
VNGDNGIQPVVLAGQERRRLQAFYLSPQCVELHAHFARHILALARQLQVGFQVRKLACQAVIRRNLRFQALARGEDFLGGFLVLPKVRLGYLLLEGLEFTASLGGVKESSAVRRRDALTPRIVFPVRQSCLLLKNSGQSSVVSWPYS